MKHGTATNRLRKNIMFDLVKKCNLDICYRCKKKIESVNDLSIDHKVDWENVSVELFWDLDNIAFSHLKCNTKSVSRDEYGNKICKQCKRNDVKFSEIGYLCNRCTNIKRNKRELLNKSL